LKSAPKKKANRSNTYAVSQTARSNKSSNPYRPRMTALTTFLLRLNSGSQGKWTVSRAFRRSYRFLRSDHETILTTGLFATSCSYAPGMCASIACAKRVPLSRSITSSPRIDGMTISSATSLAGRQLLAGVAPITSITLPGVVPFATARKLNTLRLTCIGDRTLSSIPFMGRYGGEQEKG